jgi:hypothetical protein
MSGGGISGGFQRRFSITQFSITRFYMTES